MMLGKASVRVGVVCGDKLGRMKREARAPLADSFTHLACPLPHLEVEIETIERQVSDNGREFSTSESVLATLPVTSAQFTKETKRMTYEVVRPTASGPVSIDSTGMTALQPGDLVNIIAGESEHQEQTAAPVATSPAGEKSPTERGTNRAETGRAVPDKRKCCLSTGLAAM